MWLGGASRFKISVLAVCWFFQDIYSTCGLVMRTRSKKDMKDTTTVGLMQSTPHGICMYSLPSHFNVGLLDSTFKQPEPQPMNISPTDDPPLEGMFDTMQFSLERIFYDRMVSAAVTQRPANECVMFYVPYFVSWETSAVQNTWINPHRPALDAELLSHLTHFNSSGIPGRHHFIVVGRISAGMRHVLQDPLYAHMVKLVLEDTLPGQYENVFAVPYPTWFRFYPGLESATSKSSINVKSVSWNMQEATGCNPHWLGNLTARLAERCANQEFCSFHISPESDDWVVGGKYEGMDAHGKWWPVKILSKTGKGTYSVEVLDGHGTTWPLVYTSHMRRLGEVASAAGHDLTTKCPVIDITGQYSCGDARNLRFTTVPKVSAVGQAFVLGCHRGPCWLWGSCQDRGAARDDVARRGPLVSIVGSARKSEYERLVIFHMCQERPALCSVFSTGDRENSTSFIKDNIAGMYQVIMASTFCINPPGDSPTRKGIFDSLVLGCIPVITDEDSLQHYRFHLPFWRSVSMLVTTETLFAPGFNLIDYLADYEAKNPDAIAQKKNAIREAAYSLQYSHSPAVATMRGPDAFERTLEHLMPRPLSLGNQYDFDGVYAVVNVATGRRLLDTHAPALDVADALISDNGKWRIVGKGDGSCCYKFVNLASNRALFAEVNATDANKFGASASSSADTKWRLVAGSHGGKSIVNVASGRRLYSTAQFTVAASLLQGTEWSEGKWSNYHKWNLVKVE